MMDRRIPLSYEWQPKLPTMLRAADKTEYRFPTFGLWLADHAKDCDSIMRTGTLGRNHCKSLWRWLGRTDRPPKKLWVFVDKAKLEELLQEAEAQLNDR
jgi:hypothetical protein